MSNRPDHTRRSERNHESKAAADHDREPWSQDELDFLVKEFNDAKGNPEEEAVVAECLGRTIEACRQRYYITLANKGKDGVEAKHAKTGVAYIGAMDDDEDRWWDTSSNSNTNPNK